MDQISQFMAEVFDFIDSQDILSQPSRDCCDKTLNEIGLDSLELIDLSLAIERKFNKRVDFDKMDSSSTLKTLIEDLLDIDSQI